MTHVSDDDLPEWTGEELSLLRSADDDAPALQSLPATLAAVSVGGALASGAAVAKGATTGRRRGLRDDEVDDGLCDIQVGWGGPPSAARSSPARSLWCKGRNPAACCRDAGGSRARYSRGAGGARRADGGRAGGTGEQCRSRSGGSSGCERGRTARERRLRNPTSRSRIAALDEARTALGQGRSQEALAAVDRLQREVRQDRQPARRSDGASHRCPHPQRETRSSHGAGQCVPRTKPEEPLRDPYPCIDRERSRVSITGRAAFPYRRRSRRQGNPTTHACRDAKLRSGKVAPPIMESGNTRDRQSLSVGRRVRKPSKRWGMSLFGGVALLTFAAAAGARRSDLHRRHGAERRSGASRFEAVGLVAQRLVVHRSGSRR